MIVSQENSILTLKYMTEEKENQFFDRKSAKKSVKEMTGLDVLEVNVHVQGVHAVTAEKNQENEVESNEE